jgi:hypothetical protein
LQPIRANYLDRAAKNGYDMLAENALTDYHLSLEEALCTTG